MTTEKKMDGKISRC
uniref:Uncharacterized protein n=1 Tax=Arundo donax TaxID=35708 RepID=A0A0A9C8Z1_ARUDO